MPTDLQFDNDPIIISDRIGVGSYAIHPFTGDLYDCKGLLCLSIDM